ncbi:hypothetical protein [Methanobacterium oryzae]|uniref:hypothetical protein n=1 Tax=Methanobacterium oryzae TaxID=69540 RepID=UPI003D23ABF2
MQKNLYLLICFIISIAFFIQTANALTEVSTGSSSNQVIDEAPSTVFDGPPPSIFDGPPTTVFDANDGSLSQSGIENSELPFMNISDSNNQSTFVRMQKTGLSLPLIIMAILLLFAGFIRFKRK